MTGFCAFMRAGGWRDTFGGMSRARSGMWRSPITRMRNAIVPLDTFTKLRGYEDEGLCLNASYRVQGSSAKTVEVQREVGQGAVVPGSRGQAGF